MLNFEVTIQRDGKPLTTVTLCDCSMEHLFMEMRRHIFRTLSRSEQAEFLEFTGGRDATPQIMRIWSHYASLGYNLSIRRVSQ